MRTPNVEVHSGVSPWELLDPHVHAVEEREQDVVATTLFSAEPRTAPFEAIRVSEGEFSQRSPAFVFPFFPHEGSGTSVYVSAVDSIGNRWSDFEQLLGNAQNFSMVSGGDSKPFTIPLEDSKTKTTEFQVPVDTHYRNFVVVMDELPPGVDLGGLTPVAIQGSDATPEVCLRLSSGYIGIGDSVIVRAVVTPVQAQDIKVELKFSEKVRKLSDINQDLITVTIPAGKEMSDPFKFNIIGGYNSDVSGYVLGVPDVAHAHSDCLCPNLLLDPAPSITLSASPNPVVEGQSVTITAAMSYGIPIDQTVPLHYPNPQDTAVDPGDYTSLASITIKAYNTKGSGQIQTHKDNAGGGYREFTVGIDEGNLQGPVYHHVGDPEKVKITIIDDDLPALHFVSAKSSVYEDVGTHYVSVDIDPKPVADFTFSYTLGGTATNGKDYKTVNSVTVSVPANVGSVSIPIKIVDDGEDEHDETVILTLVSGGTKYRLESPSEHEITIVDNDEPLARFVFEKGRVKEDVGTHNIDVTIDPVPVSSFKLCFEVSGTASSGQDYIIPSSWEIQVPAHASSAKIPVVIKDDHYDEHEEMVILTLIPSAGHKLGSPRKHELTIVDNDVPRIGFSLYSSNVTEDVGTHDMSVVIAPAPVSDFTFSYTLGGTATADSDYTITSSGSVKVSALATLANIPVKIIDDQLGELDETVILTFTAGTGNGLLKPSIHKLTIMDDDHPRIRFVSAKGSVNENAGTYDTKVTIDPAPVSGFTLNYSVLDGTATGGSDYTINNSWTVSVPALATSVNIPVKIIDDAEIEPDETLLLQLELGVGYNMRNPTEHELTIVDNEYTPYARFASAASSALEDTGTYEIEVLIHPSPASDFTLSYTLGGTADEDSDYTITGSGTVSVSAGSKQVKIPVVVTDDSEDELDETVILTLTSGTGYSVGSQKEHTLTIEDNDTPAAGFALVESSVLEDTGTHEIEVRIDRLPASDFTLSYTLGGTADEDSDYIIAGSGSVLVSANATSVKIPIAIINDQLDEVDETVILTLTAGTEYSVG
ncbi:MAG: hypothetical protein F4Y81_02425, partial [Rhodothermaceae bacterium]|nr:hypothetical protein [Rhodothermaceae bacterium]